MDGLVSAWLAQSARNRGGFGAVRSMAISFRRWLNHAGFCLYAVDLLLARQHRREWIPELDEPAAARRARCGTEHAPISSQGSERDIHYQTLERGEILRLDRKCGYQRLGVGSGVLWVTGAGICADLLLRGNEKLIL